MSIARESYVGLKPRVKRVEVPEYGTFYLRVPTLAERAAYLAHEDTGPAADQAAMLAPVLADESGARVFTDSDDDLSVIKNLPVTLADALRDEAGPFSYGYVPKKEGGDPKAGTGALPGSTDSSSSSVARSDAPSEN